MKILNKNIIITLLLLLTGIVLNAYNGFAQNDECGTIVTQEMVKEIIAQRQKTGVTNPYSKKAIKNVVVQFHIVQDENGNGGLIKDTSSGSTVIQEIGNKLQELFNPVGFQFNFCPTKFIKNTDYHKIISNGTIEDEMARKYNSQNAVNVYFLKNTSKSRAYFSRNWFIIKNDQAKNGVTVAHEMGHYFGLLHTDGDKDANNFEKVKRAGVPSDPCPYNWNVLGDLLEDTPADIHKNMPEARNNSLSEYVDVLSDGSCVFKGFLRDDGSIITDECGDTYQPDINNIMSYTKFECRTSFSQDQIDVMVATRTDGKRKGIVSKCADVIHPNCFDGETNGDEEEKNCGGSCPPCDPSTFTSFECTASCNSNIVLDCSVISAGISGNTIVISNTRITNNENTTITNLQIEFAFVGNGGEIPLTTWVPLSNVVEEIPPKTAIWGPAPVLRIPEGLSGTYKVRVNLSGTTNSCLSTESLNIGIDEPSPPVTSGDIDLELIYCPNFTKTDNGYAVDYKLQNNGSETIPATQLGVYLSSDEILDENDDLLKETTIQSLGSGYSIYAPISFSIDNAALPEGDVYVILKLDKDNIASETNEGNNICVKRLKGGSCEYSIINNSDCEIDLLWSNYNFTEYFGRTTIPPFGTSITTIEDGFHWYSNQIKEFHYKTAHCASPNYTINSTACISAVCNKADGYISHAFLNKNYQAENYIIAPFPNSANTVKANNQATLKAGEYIRLLPGFTARYGSDFSASIEACSNESAPKISAPTAELSLRNYPNPFNHKTNIEFDLSNDSKVTLFVSDMMGNKVATLLNNEQLSNGFNSLTFDGSSYPPGMYYYTIQAGDYVETQKMILMK